MANLALLAAGAAFLSWGALNVAFPGNETVRNFVGPSEWQRDPDRAARKQRRYTKFVGYGFVLFGVCLVYVGA
jgi:hypothetical protein